MTQGQTLQTVQMALCSQAPLSLSVTSCNYPVQCLISIVTAGPGNHMMLPFSLYNHTKSLTLVICPSGTKTASNKIWVKYFIR